ncbi:MAG: membrane protein insertase YidC [Oscillospiraceae bacterium]
MQYVIDLIGTALGYVMWLAYSVVNNYGLAIILFTVVTKIITFPLSMWVQKNSVKLVKIKPELDALKYQYTDDEKGYLDAQLKMFKDNKYSPMAGVLPLLVQIPLIMGLIDIVYKPLKHLLHLSPAVIEKLIIGASTAPGGQAMMGRSPQLAVVNLLRDPAAASYFAGLKQSIPELDGILENIQNLDMSFLGINLAQTPSIAAFDLLFSIPVVAALSALLMCVVQNKINVLQIEQSAWNKWGVTVFLVLFSGYFAFLVPAGIGLYWITGNLLAIAVTYLCNVVYDPKKYIDYASLERTKNAIVEKRSVLRENRKRSKAYYKEFLADDNQAGMKVAFYSKSSGYFKYFETLIDGLLENSDDLIIHYITSDPKDAIFTRDIPRIKPYYIDDDRLIPLMMMIESDVVVMTTPDLEKYHIKRSRVRKDTEYIFLDHGCVGINMCYRTGALDNYDTFFAVSQNQIDEIRAIEKLRGTKEKKIVKYGYGLIDSMIAAYESESHARGNDKKTILIAPSWQYDNILDSCIDDLLTSLFDRGYRIIVRPHPQYILRFPMNLQSLLERYEKYVGENFVLETDFSSNASVYNSDLLITDWSAIAFEFSFTTCKPSLFVNTEMKITNKDYDKIDIVPYDITGRDEIGVSISKEQVKNADIYVRELFDHQSDYYDKIKRIRSNHFFNLGNSKDVGSQYILATVEEKEQSRQH